MSREKPIHAEKVEKQSEAAQSTSLHLQLGPPRTMEQRVRRSVIRCMLSDAPKQADESIRMIEALDGFPARNLREI